MMAIDHTAPNSHTGISGAFLTGRDVLRSDGIRGLYRGFGTVLFGAIPARVVYLAALESTKSGLGTSLQRYTTLPDPVIASSASFVAGGAASMAGQLVIVPVDVVSQRLMIMNHHTPADGRRPNGVRLARQIVGKEGVRGLYRGLGASIATFAPSSAIWWSAYGGWQSVLWKQIDAWRSSSSGSGSGSGSGSKRTEQEILQVQVVAGIFTGCTSAAVTTPLDVVKTRLQTIDHQEGVKPTWRGTASQLYRAEGAWGFFRGVAPRMVSTSIWGTAMVTTYEFLKRMCMLPEDEVAVVAAAVGNNT